MRKNLVEALVAAVNAPGIDLAAAALVIARLEYPRLDASAYLARLDAFLNVENPDLRLFAFNRMRSSGKRARRL